MRFIIHFATMAVIALAVGFGLSFFALDNGRFFGAYRWGPWLTWPEIGSPDPDPYTRARISRGTALELGRGEGIRFVADSDDSGEPLRLDCTYRVAGPTPVAAFWTLRATGRDGGNIARPGGAVAMNSKRLSRDPEGVAVIHVGRQLSPGNWLEVTGSGTFQLVLTFYDASFFSGVGTSVSSLPAIVREGCA